MIKSLTHRVKNQDILRKLSAGNQKYLSCKKPEGDVSPNLRLETSSHGQRPYAIVVTCSDSRVIPEAIFCAGLGELFIIRVAGNVIDNHQLGSIEYAAAHLHCRMIIVLGHTKCGAVAAAMEGHNDDAEGYIKYITGEIHKAIKGETDDRKACILNVERSVRLIENGFKHHPEINCDMLDIVGAVYDIETGNVDWLDLADDML